MTLDHSFILAVECMALPHLKSVKVHYGSLSSSQGKRTNECIHRHRANRLSTVKQSLILQQAKARFRIMSMKLDWMKQQRCVSTILWLLAEAAAPDGLITLVQGHPWVWGLGLLCVCFSQTDNSVLLTTILKHASFAFTNEAFPSRSVLAHWCEWRVESRWF